jgi:hypothetical protein
MDIREAHKVEINVNPKLSECRANLVDGLETLLELNRVSKVTKPMQGNIIV